MKKLNKLNGVIIDGKFYEAVEGKVSLGSQGCALHSRCKVICLHFDGDVFFRLNQEITDIINGNGGRQD